MSRKNFGLICIVILCVAVLMIFYVTQSSLNDEEVKVKKLVNDAVARIEENGESVFSDLREKGSKWFYDDTYVFVWQTDGIRLVYPPDQMREGENMSSLTDVNGKEIGKMFIDTALSSSGEGWIEYSWPKPNETEASNKKTFIKLAVFGEQKYLVGSGFYLEK